MNPTQPKPSTAPLPATVADIAPAVEVEKTPAIISGDPAAQQAVEQARADLAQRLGVDAADIELLGVAQRWKATSTSDTPGQANGWSIDMSVGAKRYRFHVDAQGKLHRLP